MSFKVKHVAAVCATAFTLASPLVFATNGIFLPGYGIQSESMGGVGIASGQDSISAAANPANLSYVGMRGDVDLTVFNPNVKANVTSPCSLFGFSFGCYRNGNSYTQMGWVESTADLYFIPNMGMSMPLNEKLSAGLAFVAASGMGSAYNPNFFSFNATSTPVPANNSKVGIQLMQLIVPISIAYKPVESQSLGFSLVPAAQRFSASGLDAFSSFGISSDPSHMTGQGFDFSYGAGARIGWIGKFLDNKLALGATYSSKTYMTKLDKYRGLFPNGGEFDIPANFGFGITLRPTDKWMIAFDLNKIMYRDVAAFGNAAPGLVGTEPNITALYGLCNGPTYAAACLGQPGGMGFGWKNQTVYKFGVAYKATEKLTLKAGYNYAASPIPDTALTFNLLAPATSEKHYSIGMTYTVSDNLDVSAMYMRSPPHSQYESNLQVINSGGFTMNQNYLGIGASWILDRPAR